MFWLIFILSPRQQEHWKPETLAWYRCTATKLHSVPNSSRSEVGRTTRNTLGSGSLWTRALASLQRLIWDHSFYNETPLCVQYCNKINLIEQVPPGLQHVVWQPVGKYWPYQIRNRFVTLIFCCMTSLCFSWH